jgi:hypothetical protein
MRASSTLQHAEASGRWLTHKVKLPRPESAKRTAACQNVDISEAPNNNAGRAVSFNER